MSREIKGTIMVLVAGIAWGISGVSGQYLMANGMHVNLLTSLRLLISGVVLTILAIGTQKEMILNALKRKDVWICIFLFSIFGLLLNQYAYLSAIYYTNAGTATVLQYLTPVLLMGFICIKRSILPTKIELLAVVLAILGTFIIATHGQLMRLAITPLGLFWGLLSAITYALYILIPEKQIREWGSLVIIGPGMLMSGLGFPLAVRAWEYDFELTMANFLALIGIIGVGTIFAYTVFLKGTTIVGAVKGSLLASIEPVASVVIGIIIMNEHFYVIDLLGMVLIVLAVVFITVKDLS